MPDDPRLPLVESLTEREMDVLSLLSEGKTNREIAEELVLSVNTVKWYARQIYGKLGVGNREDAAEKALALGLLPGKRSERLPKHNLPAQLTPFVGRQQELSTLTELLLNPAVRLLTLVGHGGIGKTRLAFEVASVQMRMAPGALRDGLFFVTLAEVEEVQAVTEALIQTLDVPRMQGERDPALRLQHYLRDKQLLLLLDNVEHLAGQELSGWIAELLRAAPDVKVLATSRRRLNVRGEQLFWVEGLKLPTPNEEGPLQSAERLLEESSALALFSNTARRVQPKFALTDENVRPVIEICQLVEAMPLGIELAAGWMGLLEPGELLREVHRTPDILATKAGNVPSRQRSLRAVFDTSWRLLTSLEREVMQTLSIFRGGFTHAAAEEIGDVTLPLLLALVNKCWLKRDEQGRFSLHQLLRQYGMEALAAEPEQFVEIRRRHSRYFCDWLAAREEVIVGPRHEAVLVRVAQEMGNILAACMAAVKGGEAALLYPALNTLGRYYRWRGRYRAGDRAFSRLQQAVAARGRPSRELQMLHARILVWRMRFNSFLGRTSKDRAFAQEARSLVDRLEEDGQPLPYERMQLAITSGYYHLHRTPDPQKALHYFSVGHELARKQGSHFDVGMVLLDLARARRSLGDLEEAEQLIARGIALLPVGPALSGMIVTRATILIWMSRLQEARALLKDHSLTGPHPAGGIYRQFNLARVEFLLGEFEQADALASEAVTLCLERKIVRELVWAQAIWARAKLHQGRYLDAITLTKELIGKVDASWKPEVLAFAHYLQGARALAQEEPLAAGEYVRRSRGLHSPTRTTPMAHASFCLALADRGAGNDERARQHLRAHLKLVLASRDFAGLMLALMVAALLLADGNALERAGETYACALKEPFVQNSIWLQAIAGRELAEVVAQLSSATWEEAQERGRALDLWETAAALLEEFGAG